MPRTRAPADPVALIKQAGEALYDTSRWQAGLARDLAVNKRTIRAWMERRWNPGANVLPRIAALVERKRLVLQDLQDLLPPT